jgi:hypothetical protein
MAAKHAERLTAVVVFATPPLLFTIDIISMFFSSQSAFSQTPL